MSVVEDAFDDLVVGESGLITTRSLRQLRSMNEGIGVEGDANEEFTHLVMINIVTQVLHQRVPEGLSQ